MEKKSVWEKYTEADKKKAFDFADGYKDFLSLCKTEREAVDYVINDIEKQGYVEFPKAVKSRRKLKAGDKVYFCNMNKGIILFQLGKKPLEDGKYQSFL